ncbi:hypothetical protein D3C81_1701770 [compost metagenome]
MAAGADLEEATVAQALFIQALGQQHTVIREWHREIDPSHLWVGSGHRRLTTSKCSEREQQCQLAHGSSPKTPGFTIQDNADKC